MSRAVIVLFWDQLTIDLKIFKKEPNIPVVMIEAWDDFTHVAHHKKKIVFILSAMRHFKDVLVKKRTVDYIDLESQPKGSTFISTLSKYIKDNKIEKVLAVHPSEYRQLKNLEHLEQTTPICLELYEDERFVCPLKDGLAWSKKLQNPLMETFYRMVRKKTGYLMENDKPVGGQWNYDKENRSPPKKGMNVPKIDGFEPDALTQNVMSLVNKYFKNHFGDIEPYWVGATRKQALTALSRFINIALKDFGAYQDAMLDGEVFLFHAVLSHYINIGLLVPTEVCDKVEQAYFDGNITLACSEGFIRQVIGWREYVRVIYWANMPGYATLNVLGYKNALPDFYWTGDTKLKCLAHTISQTKKHAYSHHIQRLMITGNFAMLIGVMSKLIHEWYLIVYMDAFEWVEMPNTIGMATYADGGIVGTKPYVAGGNYINKMSNFCGECHYNVKEKSGKNACPFNYLYWNFLIEHKEQLQTNQRLRMPYATLNKMTLSQKTQIQLDAKVFIEEII